MKRAHYIGPILFLMWTATAVAGCGGGGSSGASASTSSSPSTATAAASAGGARAVAIRNFSFTPRTITVKKGALITISNRDSTAHTVTSDDGTSFDTGNIEPGSLSTLTLGKTRRFPYHCSIHPFMHGSVVVQSDRGSS